MASRSKSATSTSRSRSAGGPAMRSSSKPRRIVAEYAFTHAKRIEAKVFGGPKFTVSPVYEGMFKEELDAAAKRHPDVRYDPQLIDATYALLVATTGESLVIPALNRDGDTLSDLVIQMFGTIAGAESTLLAFDDHGAVKVAMTEAPHGTAPSLQGKKHKLPGPGRLQHHRHRRPRAGKQRPLYQRGAPGRADSPGGGADQSRRQRVHHHRPHPPRAPRSPGHQARPGHDPDRRQRPGPRRLAGLLPRHARDDLRRGREGKAARRPRLRRLDPQLAGPARRPRVRRPGADPRPDRPLQRHPPPKAGQPRFRRD